MKRVVLIVMDSVGIGGARDAARFGGEEGTDEGANTLGHIAEAFARGEGDHERRARGGPLRLPHLDALGLGRAVAKSSGLFPPGLDPEIPLEGGFAVAGEISSGVDTPSGHWEIAGVPVLFDWTYFPDEPDCFPRALVDELLAEAGLSGSLGHCRASGTEIIARLGEEHARTGQPIFYTSADSVFQVAAHEDEAIFGLERLYRVCEIARAALDRSGLEVGRVIARPFIGEDADSFKRTGHRRDYAVPPPAPTVLQKLVDDGGQVIGIGKIGDIYAHTGMSEEVRASGHPALWEETLAALDRAGDRSVVMSNFVDFDALYGHRRDVAGYGAALEEFDERLPELFAKLREGDLLVITADHGNDPTWPGTDHTRENVAVLMRGAGVAVGKDYGFRETFADIGQTIAGYLGVEAMEYGTAIFQAS